jgi:hypothetical protein
MANTITSLPSRCSLYQAFLWVAEECPPIEDLIFDSLPDPTWMAVEEKHKRDLLVALKTGTLRGEGVLWDLRFPRPKLENPCTDIEPKYWEWEKVDWQDSVLWIARSGDVRNDRQFTEITVPAEALLKTFPSERKPLALEAPSREGSSRRGRPPKFNWPAFYAEIAVRADLDGLPDTQAELERAMAEWCSLTWGEVPGESTVRQFVSLIYSHRRKARK